MRAFETVEAIDKTEDYKNNKRIGWKREGLSYLRYVD